MIIIIIGGIGGLLYLLLFGITSLLSYFLPIFIPGAIVVLIWNIINEKRKKEQQIKEQGIRREKAKEDFDKLSNEGKFAVIIAASHFKEILSENEIRFNDYTNIFIIAKKSENDELAFERTRQEDFRKKYNCFEQKIYFNAVFPFYNSVIYSNKLFVTKPNEQAQSIAQIYHVNLKTLSFVSPNSLYEFAPWFVEANNYIKKYTRDDYEDIYHDCKSQLSPDLQYGSVAPSGTYLCAGAITFTDPRYHDLYGTYYQNVGYTWLKQNEISRAEEFVYMKCPYCLRQLHGINIIKIYKGQTLCHYCNSIIVTTSFSLNKYDEKHQEKYKVDMQPRGYLHSSSHLI